MKPGTLPGFELRRERIREPSPAKPGNVTSFPGLVMGAILLKPAEPVTLLTDSILALQAGVYGFVLFRIWCRPGSRNHVVLAFTVTFLFIAAFALCGAVSHGTTSSWLSERTWPPTVIFGGLAFFSLSMGVLLIDPQRVFRNLVPVFIGLLLGYLAVLAIAGWQFIVFAGYQLLCSGFIFWICHRIKAERFRKMTHALMAGLGILLFAGAIQAAGSFVHMSFPFGAQGQYLFKPHNDVFHLIAMGALAVMYTGFRDQYKGRGGHRE